MRVNQPLSWELMDILKSTFPRVGEESSFISWLQVVSNVEESGSIESRTKSSNLCISWDQTSEPIVSNAY